MAAPAVFIRGNANDDARLNLADPIYILSFLFHHGPPAPCEPSMDANADGLIGASDSTYLIAYLLAGGGQPPAPFPHCDRDPTGPLAGPCPAAPSSPGR